MNPDKCCWPNCRDESEIIVEGKPLCDRHTVLVMSESRKITDQSRKTIGLKPISVIAVRDVTPAERGTKCAVVGCPGVAMLWVDGKIPVCSWHTKPASELEKLGLLTEIVKIDIPEAPEVEMSAETEQAEPEQQDSEQPDPVSAEPTEDWEARFANGEFD